jgi:acyl-CoA thioester hydrolase
MQQPEGACWRLRRRVLPQHTDHAGVMWHGAYLGWLEEARVEALAGAGLAYSTLADRGLALPVVGVQLEFRQALLHGEWVELRSQLLAIQGLKLPWRSQFIAPDGAVAAEALVELVLVDLSGGPARPRLVRRLPEELKQALAILQEGPPRTSSAG